MRTKARIRYKKQERIQRQANERILQTLSSDQRRIIALSQDGYETSEIARELALTPQYVAHFSSGLIQRLTHDGLIPSPEWRNVMKWAAATGLLPNPYPERQ